MLARALSARISDVSNGAVRVSFIFAAGKRERRRLLGGVGR